MKIFLISEKIMILKTKTYVNNLIKIMENLLTNWSKYRNFGKEKLESDKIQTQISGKFTESLKVYL